MGNTVNRFYNGELFTLKVVNGQMISAYHEDGAKVFNPALLDTLEKIF